MSRRIMYREVEGDFLVGRCVPLPVNIEIASGDLAIYYPPEKHARAIVWGVGFRCSGGFGIGVCG